MTGTMRAKTPLDPAAVLADLAEWWRNPGDTGLRARGERTRIAGSHWDQRVAEGTQNPYWEIVRQFPLESLSTFWGLPRPEPAMYVMSLEPHRIVVSRDDLCGTFSWSVPSPGDMAWMRRVLGGRGTVEAGAGGGYWSWQMRQAGIDAVAYEPLDIEDNKYACREWAELLRDGHGAPRHHPDRALFLCWPSYGDPWAAQALASYAGDQLIYCGEGDGGCCADDEFFKLIDSEWEETGSSPAHVSYWGIHCYLTAYRRKGS